MNNKKLKKLNRKLNSIKSNTKLVIILLLLSFCTAVNQTLSMELRVWGAILMIFSFIMLLLSLISQGLIEKELIKESVSDASKKIERNHAIQSIMADNPEFDYEEAKESLEREEEEEATNEDTWYCENCDIRVIPYSEEVGDEIKLVCPECNQTIARQEIIRDNQAHVPKICEYCKNEILDKNWTEFIEDGQLKYLHVCCVMDYNSKEEES